jgi:rare lipoprotein A
MGLVPRRTQLAALALAVTFTSAACATKRTPAPAPPAGTPRTGPSGPLTRALDTVVGLASYYGERFHGRTTASGVRFDMRKPVAAHPSYPFGTRVRVTNLANKRAIVVTIIDRGPTRRYQKAGVIIDLAKGAAQTLGFIRQGRQRVRIEVLEWGQ